MSLKPLCGIVMALANTVAAKDLYMARHQHRVAHIACAIAKKMGAEPEFIEGLRVMGFLYDLGKIAIPDTILCKPNKLTAQEYDLVKIHPGIAHDIFKGIDFPWPVAQAVLQHHERLDGSGYPHGLSAKEIIMEARILAVADVVAAITSHRPHRPAMGLIEAFEEITGKSGVLYDPEVVKVCLEVCKPQLRGLRYGRLRPRDLDPTPPIPSY
ncbi:MAG: HD domain-containing phosphohydrolase [Thermodesulfobacteriota bacterium]